MLNKSEFDNGIKCIEAQLKDGYIDLGTHDELELQIIREAVELYKVRNRGKTLKEVLEIVSTFSDISIYIYDDSESLFNTRLMVSGTVDGIVSCLNSKWLLSEVREINALDKNEIKIMLYESEE